MASEIRARPLIAFDAVVSVTPVSRVISVSVAVGPDPQNKHMRRRGLSRLCWREFVAAANCGCHGTF